MRPAGRGLDSTGLFSHSFVHYKDLYSIDIFKVTTQSSSRPSTPKRSFKARVGNVGMNPGEQSLCKWKPFPHIENARQKPCDSASEGNGAPTPPFPILLDPNSFP